METRITKLIVNKPGGTASSNSKSYKISIPTSWVNNLKLNSSDDSKVIISFDGKSIIIKPIQSIDEIKSNNPDHDFITLKFYDSDYLCSLILADKTSKNVYVENYTDNIIKTAFGVNTNPQWSDFLEFLEDRCIPRTRAGLQYYFEYQSISEYDPFEIISKTQGRMAEDQQWLEII
ncbi:MAG: hypothetical protein MJ108_00730 [Saccharofermentans sp.]|nr:hypothetical protein [Saccharofermentans sp.]